MSKNSDQTPGPWAVNDPWQVETPDGDLLCEVDSEADAHLISAAPELLKSLEAILFEIRSDPMSVQFFDLRMIEKANQAVAKAKGLN